MKKIYLLLFLLISSVHSSVFADDRRVGLAIGPIFWGFGFLSLNYDQTSQQLFSNRHWTVGGEFSGLGGGFFIAPRVFYWQNPNMSGFYVGPELGIGVIHNSYYHHHRFDDGRSDFFIGGGAQGGWMYRFDKGPKNMDLGAGLEILATNFGLWGAVKFTIGYLFH